MTNYKDPAPVHYVTGDKSSACGLSELMYRDLKYTFAPSEVSCGHCRRWMRKHGELPETPKAQQS